MKGSKALAKKTAKVVVNKPPMEEDEEFSSESGSSSDISDDEPTGAINSDNEVAGSDSDSDSDSDSLHQDGPRKRRRTSPETTGGDKTKRRLISSGVTVPSRIRRVERPTPTQTSTTAPPPESIAGPTAPADADTTFATLGVVPWLGQSLASLAIKRPTAIQKATIPEILKGRDCIGGSRTGSGKTVAFAVPMIQRWAENPTAIFGLILTPTR
jgi:ATP-dependent RNA helicase DDX49/DBP8